MIYGLEILIHDCLLDSARTWTWSSLACFGFRKYFHRANFPWNSLATIFISFGVGAKVIFLNDFLYVFWTSFRSLLILVDSCWFLLILAVRYVVRPRVTNVSPSHSTSKAVEEVPIAKAPFVIFHRRCFFNVALCWSAQLAATCGNTLIWDSWFIDRSRQFCSVSRRSKCF